MSNRKELNDKVAEFIQVITNTDEYETYKKAQNSFETNETAKKLLAEFQDAQQTYVVFRRGNFPGTEEQEKKLRELQKRVQQSHEIINMISSQQNLQELTADLVNKIAKGIDFPFVAPQAGGGCCG
jgi:cell fate (sporulation/competence/biofilm development) regulator YlbF (YheA/YmcA/DUF963 family)